MRNIRAARSRWGVIPTGAQSEDSRLLRQQTGVAVGVPGGVVGVAVAVPTGVPVARARAVAVVQAAETVPATLEPTAVIVPLTALLAPETLVAAALIVGAALVAAPVTVVAAALMVGAALVAAPAMVVAAAAMVGALLVTEPAIAVTAALTVGARRVAEPVTLVAPLATVAFVALFPHAASKSGTRRNSAPPPQTRRLLIRIPVMLGPSHFQCPNSQSHTAPRAARQHVAVAEAVPVPAGVGDAVAWTMPAAVGFWAAAVCVPLTRDAVAVAQAGETGVPPRARLPPAPPVTLVPLDGLALGDCVAIALEIFGFSAVVAEPAGRVPVVPVPPVPGVAVALPPHAASASSTMSVGATSHRRVDGRFAV